MSAKRKLQLLLVVVALCVALPFTLLVVIQIVDYSVLAAASGWYGYNGSAVCPEPTSSGTAAHGLSERRNNILPGTGSPIQYLNGVLEYQADGISIPSPGFGFSHRLTYNNNHEGGTESANDGNIDLPNGWNWHTGISHLVDMGSGEIRHVGIGTSASKYVDAAGYGTYSGKFGIDSKIKHDTTNDELILHATNGATAVFYDFDSAHGDKFGGLKEVIHPGGDKLTVDYYTAAESSNLQDLVEKITDIGGHEWVYTYIDNSADTNNRRISKVEVKNGTTVLAKVEYLYYDSFSSQFGSGSGGEGTGTNGDLMRLKVTERDSNGLNLTRTTLFRYWTGSWSTQNPGAKHKLKYIVGPQGYAELDAVVGDPLGATDTQVEAEADYTLEYNSDGFVTEASVQGAGCSCSGGEGIYTYTYTTNSSWTSSSSFDTWKVSVKQVNPDGTVRIVDVNGAGSIINDVFQTDEAYNSGTDQRWITHHKFDTAGRLKEVHNPSANLSYTESTHAVAPQTLKGLARLFVYDTNGNLTDRKLKKISTGTAYWLEKIGYGSVALGDNTLYYPNSKTVFRSENTSGTGGDVTTVSFDSFHPDVLDLDGDTLTTDNSLQVKDMTITHPVVPSSNPDENGSGIADTHTYHFTETGELEWEKDEEDLITYRAYDADLGLLTQVIVDPNTTGLNPPTSPTDYRNTGTGLLELDTTYDYLSDGSLIETVDPTGRTETVHYTHLYSGEPVTLRVGHIDSGGPVGPCSITVRDLGGNVVTSAIGVLDSDGDLDDDFDETATAATLEASFAGNLYQRTEYVYEDGHKTEERRWTDADDPTEPKYVTEYGYDNMGRLARVKDAEGTINRTDFTTNGRVRQRRIGTNDSGDDDGLEEATGTDNMSIVEKLYYDDEETTTTAVGDGNLTESRKYTTSASYRTTSYTYDWRNRRTETDGAESFYSKVDYDNQGRVIASYRYDGSDSASNLRSKIETEYDSRGRVYESIVWEVDPADGTIGASLITETWYDGRGALLKRKNPSGLFAKTSYDVAGRVEARYTSYDTSESSWDDADDVDDDIVVSQVEFDRDDVGNVILETRYERKSTHTGEDALDSTSGVRYYAASWYDDIHRLIDRANYGTNGGATLTLPLPSSAPGRSDTILVTSYAFDEQGLLQDTTAPGGRVKRTEYDQLGRRVRVIDNYVNGTPGTGDDDRKLQIAYNGVSKVTSRKVWVDDTATQETKYEYGVTKGSTAGDSEIASNNLLKRIRYPDPSTGSPSANSDDQKSFAYNVQAELIWRKDQNGIIHEFTYDGLGRRTDDAVTTTTPLPDGIDDAILRISTEYDSLDRRIRVTSYDAAAAGTAQNEVQLDYNGFGQVTSSWQEHGGAVDDDGMGTDSLRVRYSCSEAEGTDPVSRLNWVEYPGSGRRIYFYYDDFSGANDHAKMDWIMVRISAVSNDSSSTGDRLANYTYEGIRRVRERLNEEPTNNLDVDYSYDRFGRPDGIDASTGSTINDLDYGYNRDSKIVWREEDVGTVHTDELYTYDDLGRLDTFERGDLDTSVTPVTISSLSREQDWSLDLVGNWESILTGDGTSSTTVDRDHNDSNEITDVDESTSVGDPSYDKNGNTTVIGLPEPASREFTYDAWNRVVRVENGVSTLAQYEYDGLDRRVRDTTADEAYFYSRRWQLLVERDVSENENLKEYVWGIKYVDEVLERSEDSNSDGDTRDAVDESLFYVQDTNWNVQTLVNESGGVEERCLYDSYGAPTFHNSSWTTSSGTSSEDNRILFTGRLWNPDSSMYDYRSREYSPHLGRFAQADPIGIWGDTFNNGNAYGYVGGDPLSRVDPSGQLTATVAERTSLNCGAGECKYHLTLDEPSEHGGWIVMKITWVANQMDCFSDSSTVAIQQYYEATPVVIHQRSPAGDEISDDSHRQKDGQPGSWGASGWTAEAKYYSAGQAILDNPRKWGHLDIGGGLPSKRSKPDFWDDEPIEGDCVYKSAMLWNCCNSAPTGATNVKCTGSDGSGVAVLGENEQDIPPPPPGPRRPERFAPPPRLNVIVRGFVEAWRDDKDVRIIVIGENGRPHEVPRR